MLVKYPRIAISPELHERFKAAADAMGTSMATVAGELLVTWVTMAESKIAAAKTAPAEAPKAADTTAE